MSFVPTAINGYCYWFILPAVNITFHCKFWSWLIFAHFDTRRQQIHHDGIVLFKILKHFWFTWLIVSCVVLKKKTHFSIPNHEIIKVKIKRLINPTTDKYYGLTCLWSVKVRSGGTSAERLRQWWLWTWSWASLQQSSPCARGRTRWTGTVRCGWARQWASGCTPPLSP